MKYVDVKDLTVEELRKRLANQRQELFETKMKASLGQVNNPLEIRSRRRDVARIMTALNSKVAR